jgi:Cu/Ag efflux protein CusF
MEELKEGAQVKVVYEERDGKLVATSIEIVK